MKMVMILFILCFTSPLKAWVINERWGAEGDQLLELQCEEGDASCEQLCGAGKQSCVDVAPYCKNCIGGDLYLWQIFSSMGDRYGHQAVTAPQEDFFEFILRGKYAFFNSKSIYNLLTSYDQLALRRKFQGLCKNTDPYPQVFFELDQSHRLGKIKYVLCQNASHTEVFVGKELWQVYSP